MHAPSPPACLLRLLLIAATFSPARPHHQTWRWRGLSPYATAPSRSQSRDACLTVQAPFTAFSLTKPKPQCNARESPCFRRAYPGHEHCSGEKIAVNVFHAARLRQPLSNDVAETNANGNAMFQSYHSKLSKKKPAEDTLVPPLWGTREANVCFSRVVPSRSCTRRNVHFLR